jgi:hypothetical protein
MQRFIAPASLLVSSVSAEAASQPPLKSVLVLYGERGDSPVIRAIEQNVREAFHGSPLPRVKLYFESCDFACFQLCSQNILCR